MRNANCIPLLIFPSYVPYVGYVTIMMVSRTARVRGGGGWYGGALSRLSPVADIVDQDGVVVYAPGRRRADLMACLTAGGAPSAQVRPPCQ